MTKPSAQPQLLATAERSETSPSLPQQTLDALNGDLLYQEMFHRNTAPKLLIDADSGLIVDANAAALGFYGYTLDQIRCHRVQDLNQLSRSDVEAEMRRARSEERRYFEFQHKLANGEVRDVQVYSGPIAIGGKQYLHSIIHDVTLANQYRDHLKEYKHLFKALPIGVYRNAPGADGSFVEVNRAMVQMFRADSAQTLIQQPVVKLYRNPEERQQLSDDLIAAGEIHGREIELVRLDGTPLWGSVTARKRVDPTGNVLFEGIIEDITERKLAEASLRQSASVFEHAKEGILVTQADGSILDVNDAFCDITGYQRKEIIGQNTRILHSGRHDDAFYATMRKTLETDGQWHDEIWNRRKDGSVYAAMQTTSAVRNNEGKIIRYVSLFSDVTALKEQQAQLEHIAHYDPLTKLPNRSLLSDRLHQAMTQCQRRNTQVAVAYLDLDGFKEVNDQFGHGLGDQLLSILSQRLNRCLREGDTLARIGGDEFIGVFLDLEHPEEATPVMERLLDVVSIPVDIGNITVKVSASIGVTFFPQFTDVDGDQLIRQADQAMYLAKQSGRNRFALFDSERDRAVCGHHEEIEQIRLALTREEFRLHYQPKVNLRTGQVIGVEALIRWQHPERGLLLPGTFLPAIADDPVSVELGRWVLETAAAQAERWIYEGLHLPVSVNVDNRQLCAPDFMETLQQCLERHPALSPGDLELEILETGALEDVEEISRIITRCADLGVEFALDDFGTGYSTLTHLKRLPAKILKIDQTFVRDMLDDPEDLTILEGVQGLADAFHRQTIAEGMETTAQGAVLLSLGCHLAQGYGIARPMPGDEIPGWIARWRPDPSWNGRTRINDDDLPILFAIVEQRAWVRSLEAYLSEGLGNPPDSHACRFDQWLEETGKQRYGSHPIMSDLISCHDHYHQITDQILSLLNREHLAPARGMIPPLRQRLAQLISVMERLIEPRAIDHSL